MDKGIKHRLLQAQKSELTEHIIYSRLARYIKNPHNRSIVETISNDELDHHNQWKKFTRKSVKPSRLKIGFFLFISRILGITFGIKLMERGEKKAQLSYDEISTVIPSAKKISHDEEEHEKKLISLIDEERLSYTGAIVRGLNEAVVELTGALSGLTFAFQETGFILAAGLITGLAMSLSLGGSEYLATKSEESHLTPIKAALYTGLANLITVFLLIFPYFLLSNIYIALAWMIGNAVIVIYLYNFYISVAKDLSFRKEFMEMVLVSLGIAVITFVIGVLAREFFHIEI
ncbi:MAG: rubrerythrin family protein [Bacteroidales bacterium]|nr:rubrerythrin family protein [Bacteroidales bacterium]